MCSGVATTAINPFWIVCDYLALGVCMTSVTVSDYGELTLFGLFVSISLNILLFRLDLRNNLRYLRGSNCVSKPLLEALF
jgi:hypothetical protein